MPMYEYGCDSCGKITEMIQKFSDEPLKECPECNGAVQKLMSRTSFQLKGTGWYSTDYKKKSAPAAPVSSGSGGASGDSAAAKDGGKSSDSPAAKDGNSSGPASAVSTPATGPSAPAASSTSSKSGAEK